VFVIVGQFSRGREEEFYYETIALLFLVGKRLGQSPSRKHRSSTKCKALFSFDRVFLVFVFTSIGTGKGAHFYQRGAISRGRHSRLRGAVAPNCPLDPPLLGYGVYHPRSVVWTDNALLLLLHVARNIGVFLSIFKPNS